MKGTISLSQRGFRKVTIFLAGVLVLLLLGCGTAATATNTPAPTQPIAAPTAGPAATDSPQNLPQTSAALTGATIEVGEGSVARYLVQEQLARLSFPNDAIGETPDVMGSLVFMADGIMDGNASTITVDLTTLQSDEDRRDRYLRTRSLQSDNFPTAEFVVRETPGLPWPLPAEGEVTFQMVGDMTMRGVTRPLTWDATARFNGDLVLGQARTSFTFEEFDMDVPSVSIVLSVENEIRLEIDFVGSVIQR